VFVSARQRRGDPRLGSGRERDEGRRQAQAHDSPGAGLRLARRRWRDSAQRHLGVRGGAPESRLVLLLADHLLEVVYPPRLGGLRRRRAGGELILVEVVTALLIFAELG